MNFLVIQECGRHPENRMFREGLSMVRALKALGHYAIVWGLNYDNWGLSLGTILEHGKIDVILLLENYDTGWVPELAGVPVLKVMWSIDSHCALDQHLRTADRHKIDIVLNSTEGYLKHFEKPGRKCYWFPNCYDDTLIYPMPEIQKTVPIGFCGNYVNRKEWLDLLHDKRGLNPDIFVIGPSMVKAINSYKIHFNRNMADDVNYRTMETLGCRTMLLTNYTPNLEKMFEVWGDLAVYTSKEDLLEKVDYYLSHDTDRKTMAERGYQTVRTKHTYFERAKRLVEIAGG